MSAPEQARPEAGGPDGGSGSRRAKLIASALRRTVTGPMWHGPSLDEALAGVSAAQAAAHPVAGAHSILELVLHIRAWATIPRRRLTETIGEATTAEDWPPATDTSDAAWRAAIEAMREAYFALAADVRLLDDDALDANVLGRDHPVHAMLHGVVEHGCYHAGQIALLKKLPV